MKRYSQEERDEMRRQFAQVVPHPPKIMVCLLTFSKRIFILRELLQSLAEQSYPHLEFIILDTSPATGTSLGARRGFPELPALIKDYLPRAELLVMDSTPRMPPQIIADGREQLRQHFLASDAKYLFFIDDDTIPPPDAIATLYLDQQEAIVGVYLLQARINGGKEVFASCWYGGSSANPDEWSVTPMTIAEAIPGKVVQVDLAGLGCTLLTRVAVANTRFRYQRPFSEDLLFFRDLRERSIPLYCDTRVKCTHKRFSDATRNKILDFDEYTEGYRASCAGHLRE